MIEGVIAIRMAIFNKISRKNGGFPGEVHRESTDHEGGAPEKINVGDPTPNGEGWRRLKTKGFRGLTGGG